MKLDVTVLRHLGRLEVRVLESVEQGMKDHEWVPLALIVSKARLRHGGSAKYVGALLRDKLLSHSQACGYDGYRLTTAGYDLLALYVLQVRQRLVASLGQVIGTGKESDVYLGRTTQGQACVLKFHRLGRTSFRNVKAKRDYFLWNATSFKAQRFGGQSPAQSMREPPHSWLFLSRTSARKEFGVLQALWECRYPTPRPLGHCRHVVVMSLVRGLPLYQIPSHRLERCQALDVLQQVATLVLRLANDGWVHGDFNEYNLVVDLSGGAQSGGHKEEEDNDESTWASRTWKDARASNEKADDGASHYVRHSGLPVELPGALSAHGAWQQDEVPLLPRRFLADGVTPKPIVTLIDFPQMVSTRHPNAREMYQRDWACLQTFFGHRWKLGGSPEEWQALIPQWNDIVQESHCTEEEEEEEESTTTERKRSTNDSDDDSHDLQSVLEDARTAAQDTITSVAMETTKRLQRRLDDVLRLSSQDAHRDNEWYDDAKQWKEEDDDDEEEEENDDDDEEEEEHDDGKAPVEVLQDDKDALLETKEGPVEKDCPKDKEEDWRNANEDEEAPSLEPLQDVVQVSDEWSTHTGMASTRTARSRADLEEVARQRVAQMLRQKKMRGGEWRKKKTQKKYLKHKRVLAPSALVEE